MEGLQCTKHATFDFLCFGLPVEYIYRHPHLQVEGLALGLQVHIEATAVIVKAEARQGAGDDVLLLEEVLYHES